MHTSAPARSFLSELVPPVIQPEGPIMNHAPHRTSGRHRGALASSSRLARPGTTTTSATLTAAVAGLAVIASVGAVAANGAAHRRVRPHAVTSIDSVVNGTFAQNTAGWRTNDRTQRLARVAAGHAGPGAAELSSIITTHVVLNESANSVADTAKDGSYVASAWVRSPRPGMTGVLRLREVAGGGLVSMDKTSFQLADTAWHKVTVTHVASRNASSLDLNVIGWSMSAGESLIVDDISLLSPLAAPVPAPSTTAPTPVPTTTGQVPTTPAPTTTAPAPTTAAPTTTAPTTPAPTTPAPTTQAPTTQAPTPTTPAPGFVPRFSADLPAGSFWWGSAVGGNADPVSWESTLGSSLSARRTYFQWPSQKAALVATINADKAAGRLPTLAVKFGDWATVASGSQDADLRDFAATIAAARTPVVVTPHHEPEGGGTGGVPDGPAPDFRAMVAHMLPIVRTAPNMTVGICLMAWSFEPTSGKNVNDWWVPGVDFLGIDGYNYWGTSATARWKTPTEIFTRSADFAAAHSVPMMILETGVQPTDGVANAPGSSYQWMLQLRDFIVVRHLLGSTYFNSGLNSVAPWVLSGERQRAFGEILAGPGVARTTR